MKEKCDRCKLETKVTEVSWFNEDAICDNCTNEERIHPLYNYIKFLEHEQVMKGIEEKDEERKKTYFNFNYYDGLSWEEIVAKTPEMLYTLSKISLNNKKEKNEAQYNNEQPANMFTFEYKGQTIEDPMMDETRKQPVHPIEYYGEELLEGLIKDYKSSFISLLDD